MHSGSITARIRLFVASALAAVGFMLLPGAASAAATDNVAGWAWSGTIGWIAMNCETLGDCGTSDFGVMLTDAPGATADLNGFAWSESFGWVCFGNTCTGTTPEGGAPYAQYRLSSNGKSDQFWGWAKVLSLGDAGWISMNCDKDVGGDDCGTSDYHVELNVATGAFSGGGADDHWMWSGNDDGTGIGWVDMSGVTTTWVLASLGKVRRPAGVFEPKSEGGPCVSDAQCTTGPWYSCNLATSTCVLPGTHNDSFTISFTGFSAMSGEYLDCDMELSDGITTRNTAKELTYAGGRIVNGVESLTYDVTASDPVDRNKIWLITECRISSIALGAACAQDADCGPLAICDEGNAQCRDVVTRSTGIKPVFSHPNDWTGLDSGEDWYRAVKCFTGFPDNYFRNAAVCDFAADVSFAQSMKSSYPVEGDCGDTVDNDGNGLIDCADPACRGISYLCTGATLKRAQCSVGDPFDGIQDCSDGGYTFGALCCSGQPKSPGSSASNIVDGMECEVGNKDDGVYDCSCDSQAAFDASPTDDCFAPGWQSGDLCCDADGNVSKP